ncbi:MAG: C10 family peptidase [Bacteroidales bacterium]|nr:C10 family peptidase [Bacteroidales bacterium]
MNRNIVHILFFIFSFQYIGYTQPVNESTVSIVAEIFYSFLKEKEHTKVDKINKHYYSGFLVYYTVVFDNNDWVVVANDKRADPILAFSESKNYSKNTPPGAECFLIEYNYYVYDIITGKKSETDYNFLWDDLLNDNLDQYKNTKDQIIVEPLIATKWGQSKSNDENDPNAYNYYAPAGTDRPNPYSNTPPTQCSHTLAGCPAVAVGQVLKYWEKPKCDVFEWINMPNILNTNNQNYIQCKKEIANLLRNIGDKTTDYYYYCDESGCTTSETLNALVNDFYYPDATLVARDEYSNNEWKEILIEELINNRPVLYRGSNPDRGGHIFICDGYKKVFLGKRFHFNFGWNGDGDGYYSFQNAHGFTAYQSAIINIQPFSCSSELVIYDSYSSLPFSFSDYYYYNPEGGYIYSSPEPITINANETVNYKAYHEIVLENFETEDGAEFIAEIIPCPVLCNFTDYKNSKTRNSCFSTNNDYIFDSNDKEIIIFPNPGENQFYLQKQANDTNGRIYVYDNFGRLLFEKQAKINLVSFDLSDYHSGIYLIKYTSDKYNHQQKIIKK